MTKTEGYFEILSFSSLFAISRRIPVVTKNKNVDKENDGQIHLHFWFLQEQYVLTSRELINNVDVSPELLCHIHHN